MSRESQRKATVAASSLSLLRPSKTADDSAASSIANRLVTPSPRLSLLSSSSTPKLIGRYEVSSRNQTPRKKRLFVKKGSYASRKHTITTTTKKAENFLRSSSTLKDASSYSPKKLFSSPPDDNDDLATSRNKKSTTLTIRKGRVRNKKSSTVTTGNVSTRRRRTGINRRSRNFTVGDSLATIALITKTAPVSKMNSPKFKNKKKTCGKKRPERYPVVIATMGPNVNQKNDESSTRQTPLPADTNAEQLINDAKKKICSSRIIDNTNNNDNKKRNNSKNKNTVPAEYIPLLASRAQAVQSTRARSITEILNDIHKKKESESKNNRISGATRARLPRACKRNKRGSFQESVTDDENDEELQETAEVDEDDDDDDDYDNERTGGKDSLLSEDQHEDKRNDNVAITLFSTGIASARTNANSPKLKPRTRSFLSSSTIQDRGLLSVVPKDHSKSSFAEDDNFRKGVLEFPPKKRRRSRRFQGSSYQHQEESKNNFDTTTTNEGSTKNLAETTSNTIAVPFRQSEAAHLQKNMGNVSRTPVSRKTNKNRENTSEEKEQQKGALQRKRQSSVKRKRIGLCKNDTTEDGMINNASSSPSKRNQQRQLVQPSRLSSRRRAQHQQQFSMEEYSVYSNYSGHEEPEQEETVRTVMNPSQVSVSGVPNKISNNLTMPRRENQQCKSQNNSSLSVGEKSEISVSVCTKNFESSPSQRRMKLQQRSPRQKDKEGKASKKRVRFDSSTTTFSVKIKIKTNLDTSRNSKDRRNRNDRNTLPPSLDESTVQAIANQVTQACLTQAASTRMGTCSTINTCRDPAIDIDVDVNDEEQMSSPSSDVSSKSSESSDAEEDLKEEKGMSVYLNEIVDKQSVPINNNRINRFPLREGHDDGRSITSELTSDWNRPSRYLEHEEKREAMMKNVVQSNKDRNTCNSFVPQEHNKGRQEQDHGKACLNETFHFANDEESENDYQIDTDPATVKLQTSAQDASTTQSNAEKRPRLLVGRRQRMWHCSDSLAGSCADWSKVSTVAGLVAKKVPREVTMQKPLSRSEGRCRSRIGLMKTMQSLTTATKSSEEMNAENNDKTRERMSKNTTVIPVTPNITRKSRLVPLSPTYCCGKCKGCRRTLDCQTCDVCLEKLHCYGSLPSPSTNERLPLCLLRSCQRTCRVGRVDSLLGVASVTKPIQPKSNKNERGEHKKEHSHQESVLSKQLAENHVAAVKEKQDYTSNNVKAPWDDGDDWTVDYSYLSDPRHRGKISNSRGSKKSSYSTSLYASSWSLPLDKNRVKAGLGSGGRTSLSSVSESVISQKRSTQLPAADAAVSSNKRVRGRSVKRKRDPLHGLSLPSTSTDARKCLRALMEYDEADQDWV